MQDCKRTAWIATSLDGFETYAVALYGLLGNLDLVAKALATLLESSSDNCAARDGDCEAVVRWCLEGEALLSHGPAAIGRVLVLRHILARDIGDPGAVSARKFFLDSAPSLLAEAPGPVAEELTAAVASTFGSEGEAVAWFRSLRSTCDVGTCIRVSGAILQRHSGAEVLSDAWEFASNIMQGSDSTARRACTHRMLPTLVTATPSQQAISQLIVFIEALLEAGSRANLSDALTIAVAFHGPLLGHWRLSSVLGGDGDLGRRLIATGLRLGLKDFSSDRKQAVFLLQSVIHAALADKEVGVWLSQTGTTVQEANAAWQTFWALFDSMEEYSSHLIKQSWESSVQQMMSFLVKSIKCQDGPNGRPPFLLGPFWIEVLFCRSLAHDNDSVHKFVLGQLIKLDQGTARLSERFVLEELLPRFSHSIEALYPRSDVHQIFERQVTAFFSMFVRCHPDGPAPAARRLLEAILSVWRVHHTPLRLVLSALTENSAAGAFSSIEVGGVVKRFFEERLTQMPVSSRLLLATRLLTAVKCLAGTITAEGRAETVLHLGQALAAVPDALLAELRSPIAALVSTVLGGEACAHALELIQGLVAQNPDFPEGLGAIEAVGRRASPMAAVQLMLGATRMLWALASLESAQSCVAEIWVVLSPTLIDIHRRAYLPQRALVAALFGAAYTIALVPGSKVLAQYQEAHHETLALVAARTSVLLDLTASKEQDISWVWLYAFVLEHMWTPGLPHGEAILDRAATVMQDAGDGSTNKEENGVLAVVAASALLGALAPRVVSASRRAELFLIVFRSQVRKPSGVVDQRFSIVDADKVGSWHRVRLDEYEDLQRVDREGLGRICEWRDAFAVFYVAKWRALATCARHDDFLQALLAIDPTPDSLVDALDMKERPWSWRLATSLLEEFETLQPPHVGHWAVVARHVLYPLVFSSSSLMPEVEQRDALRRLCSGLAGQISECTGDGSTYMPRACLAELSAALCHPTLCDAERRLCIGKEDGGKPLFDSVHKLLSLGENCVSISRGVAAPLLAALLEPPRSLGKDVAATPAVDLLVQLLLHREATIADGAFCTALDVVAGALDSGGPAGDMALTSVCTGAGRLRSKFNDTPALVRVLALAGLDLLADRAEKGATPPLISGVLQALLVQLQRLLDDLLRPPGGKQVLNRPPTPMPWSDTHRLQLRGWQAMLVLGRRADAETAGRLLPVVFEMFKIPHVPDVRDFQELLGCVLCAEYEGLAVQPLLVPALQRFDDAVQVSASLLVITAYLFRRWVTNLQVGNPLPEYAASLVRAASPYLIHNSAYVRGIAAWGFFYLFDALGAEGSTKLLGADAQVLLEFHRFLSVSKECQKMRKRLHPIFLEFDPMIRNTLACLTERAVVLPLPANCSGGVGLPQGAQHTFSDGDFRLSSSFLECLKEEVGTAMEDLWDRSDPSQYPSCSDEWRPRSEGPPAGDFAQRPGDHSVANDEAATGDSGCQRKFIPLAPPSSPGEGVVESGKPRQPLIIIASLIDKMPNLAGLCRTSEIFNCEALCLANSKMTKDASFLSVSVTAEKWLPIKEIPRASLYASLLDYRRRGYELVGVEQTQNSKQLQEYRFARSGTVLLLGAEKEGIDAELLPLLDACVEIPQSGQIRSLNVHVSGSLAIWEYTKQRIAAESVAH